MRTDFRDRTLGLFIAYYAEQRAGESMHSPKHCLPGAGWEIWKYATVRVPLEHGNVPANRYSIQNGTSRALVLYWYQSRSRIIASEYMGKIMLIRDALINRSTAAAIVRITLADEPGALQSAVEFASKSIPELQFCLTGVPAHPKSRDFSRAFGNPGLRRSFGFWIVIT